MPNTKSHRARSNSEHAIAAPAPELAVENVNNRPHHRINVNMNLNHGAYNNGGQQPRMVQCSAPNCPSADELIDMNDLCDSMKVACNNDQCTESGWMHRDCFQDWQDGVLAYLRSCGRARSWSEKQRLQNLWTKKGYDLAYKACDCKCGRGHLRKDLDYIPKPSLDNANRQKKKTKKKNERPVAILTTANKPGPNSSPGNGHSHMMTNGHGHFSITEHGAIMPTARHQQNQITVFPARNNANTNINNHVNNNNNNNGVKYGTNPPFANHMEKNVFDMTTVVTVTEKPRHVQNDTCIHFTTDNQNNNHPNLIGTTDMNTFPASKVKLTSAILPIQRPQLRLRTNSLSSTGSSPPTSGASGSPAPASPGTPSDGNLKKLRFDFFGDRYQQQSVHQATSGSIFKRRADLSAFGLLPRHKQNSYHIQMEDDGPHGNDETRCFVLSNLSSYKVTALECVLCKIELSVFDRYPLIDGTFFVSPQPYSDGVVQVLSEGKLFYLNAVCVTCLEGGTDVRCYACKSKWDGSSLVLGSMYSYDIFAAMPCCQKRLTCKNCHRAVVDICRGLRYYSEYSHSIECPYCRMKDTHFIRSLSETFNVKQPIWK